MKKIFLFIVFVLVFFCVSRAQDIIVKTDSSRISAKVEEVGSTDVRYKRFDNPDGPTYTLSTIEIARIVYQNGSVDVFVKREEMEEHHHRERKPYEPQPAKYPNYISLNVFDIGFGMVTVNYERNLETDAVAIRIPVSVGLGTIFHSGSYDNTSDFYYYNRNKLFSVGFEALFFPRGQGFAKYYFGPALDYGQYNYWRVNNPVFASYQKYTDSFYSICVKNGIQIQPGPQFNVSVDGGLGLAMSNHFGYTPMVRLGLHFGYRF